MDEQVYFHWSEHNVYNIIHNMYHIMRSHAEEESHKKGFMNKRLAHIDKRT